MSIRTICTFEFLFVTYASPPLVDTDRLVTALGSCFAEPSSRKHIFSALEEGTEKLKPTIKLKVDDGEIAVLPFIICLF